MDALTAIREAQKWLEGEPSLYDDYEGSLPDSLTITDRKQTAYGDIVTYKDGHEEFHSIGD